MIGASIVGKQKAPFDVRGQLGLCQASEKKDGDGEVEYEEDESLHGSIVQDPGLHRRTPGP